MINQKKATNYWVLLVLISAFMATSLAPTMSQASNSTSLLKLMLIKQKLKSDSNGSVDCRSHTRGKYLRKGRSYTRTTKLYKGYTYAVVGAGDANVSDLDIIIYDENGRQVDKDTQSDALPIVKVSPRWTGNFRIKVKMYDGRGYSNILICYEDND